MVMMSRMIESLVYVSENMNVFVILWWIRFFKLNIYGNEYLTLFSSTSSLVKHLSCVPLVTFK